MIFPILRASGALDDEEEEGWGAGEDGGLVEDIGIGVGFIAVVGGLIGLACYIDTEDKAYKEVETKLVETIAEHNNLDDFELDMITVNGKEYTVSFTGTKSENETKQFGVYDYTIPHYSDEDLTTYEKLLNLETESKNVKNFPISTFSTLNYLVENETATWTAYTQEEKQQFNQKCAKILQQLKKNVKKEDLELTM